MLLQLVAELAHRRLIRHRLPPQIDVYESAQRPRFIQRFFHRRVRQVEPLLQKVKAQHPLHPHPPPPPQNPPPAASSSCTVQTRSAPPVSAVSFLASPPMLSSQSILNISGKWRT